MHNLRQFFYVGLLGLLICCQKPEPESVGEVDLVKANSDWTTASHSNEAAPDYTVVFPQDRVNTLEITMTAQEWQAIQTDMTAKFGGSFGAGATTGGGPGNGPPPGNGTPGQFGTDEPSYVALPVRFNGKVWNKVGFRLKGNSSLSSTWRSGIYKLPFRLKLDEFEDQFPEIKNQRLYGFQELSFSPGYSDTSLIREKVAADLFRMGGVPAAQTSFCQVYIDFGEGKKYCGVYTIVEVIDDTMVKEQFGEDQGNIYKPESTFQTFVQSEFEKKNNKDQADYSDVQAFIAALNSSLRTTDPAQWRARLEQVFNVEHYLKFLAVNNTLVNWDAYGAMAHNYYLYNSPTGKLTWIPWDHNEAMKSSAGGNGFPGGGAGNGIPGGNGRSAVSLTMTEVTSSWPLLRYVADDPVYYAHYRQYVRNFSETVFIPAQVQSLMERYHTLVAPVVIGPQATESGKYSHLSTSSDFTTALTQLKDHVISRSLAVAAFLN